MRFRGGGVGHDYMRAVEPWLDLTGWGTSWPPLNDRDPEPDIDNIGSSQQEVSVDADDGAQVEDSGKDASALQGFEEDRERVDGGGDSEMVGKVQSPGDSQDKGDDICSHTGKTPLNEMRNEGYGNGNDSGEDEMEDEDEDEDEEDLENPMEQEEVLDCSSDEDQEHGEERVGEGPDSSDESEDEAEASDGDDD